MNKMVQKTFSYIKWIFGYWFELGLDFGYFSIGVKFVSVFSYFGSDSSICSLGSDNSDRIRLFKLLFLKIRVE